MRIDPTITAKQNLLNLINQDNETGFQTEHVSFDPPESYQSQGYSQNTKIVMRAILGAGFSGSQTYYYTRLGLFSGMGSAVIPFEMTADFPEALIKRSISGILGVIEDELLFTDLIRPQSAEIDGSIKISAKADSLLYLGTYNFPLKLLVE